MSIRLSCPNCEAVATVEEQSLGRRGRCKKCGHVFALARPGGEAASAISGDASAWKRGSEPASPTNLPEQFGRYRIMRQLGQGGMGAVYLAFDTKLEREVALKVPYFTPADGPQAVQRFEREARAAATLDHPNLCPIHDVGEIDGIHYLTMPYIKGKSLSDAIGSGQAVTEAQAAAVALKIAQAIQEAHDKGIIHRDLKPGNIMVNRRRELIVMDFGLARMAGGESEPLTRSGNVLGTALYMAPEQAAGDLAAIGPTADVYSLGVILYELLTGRPPFEGPWGLVIGLKNVKDPDPPSKHRPELSPILNAICHKAIAKDPQDRYPTMAELAQELGAFLKSAPTASPVLTPSGTTKPAEKPESLAAQFFAGIVTEEVSSLRSKSSIARPEPEPSEDSSTRRPARGGIMAAAGAAAIVLLGTIIYLNTDLGRPKPKVKDTQGVVQKPVKSKKEPVGKGTSVESEGVALKGDLDEMSKADAQVTPPDNSPTVESGEPPKPAMEEGKTAPTEKSKEGMAIAGAEAKEAAKSPSTNARNGRNAAKKGAGSVNPFPPDAILFGGNRYKLFSEVLTWPEAKKKCEEMGGHLVIVNSEEENRFLVSSLKNTLVKDLWLGATDEAVEGQWVWLDGTEMKYKNWDLLMGQPNNSGGKEGIPENRLLLRADRAGTWWDTTDVCDAPVFPGFVCEWEPSREVTVPTPKKSAGKTKASESANPIARNRAPADAILFGGNRYKLFAELLTWHEARMVCEEMGGHLVIVNSEEENKFLVSLLQTPAVREIWLGATDEVVEGKWVCVDGSKMQYSNWDIWVKQPNNDGGRFPDGSVIVENYALMRMNGSWWDVPVSSAAPFKPGFVCEWEPIREAAPPVSKKSAARKKASGAPDSWHGDRFWTVQGKSIKGLGAIDPGQSHSDLYSEKSYKDFELKCRVRLKEGTGNSGIQIRSELIDAGRFLIRGPQVDIGGRFWGSLYGEDFPAGKGGMIQAAPAELVARIVKPVDFNDITIRCVGKRLTVRINGETTIDGLFPQLPDEGRIAWQIHAGDPVDLVVEDLEITDLTNGDPQAAFRPLFNGKDLEGWKPNPNWRVENRVLISSGASLNYLYTTRGDYKDFHLRAVAQINDRGNGGIFFRMPSLDRDDGYEVQIDSTSPYAGRKTGSLLKQPGGPLTWEIQAPRPNEPFTMEVIARGNLITVKVNDRVVTTYEDNDRPHLSGHIALQHFNNDSIVMFSRIDIKELNGDESAR